MLHYFVKAGIILFYFLIFPMLAGMAFQEFCKKKQVSFGECYIRGWLLMSLLGLAVFLPAIRFGMYFTYTVFVWIGVSAGIPYSGRVCKGDPYLEMADVSCPGTVSCFKCMFHSLCHTGIQ